MQRTGIRKENEATNDWICCPWVEKVNICEQGRANENALLQSYRLIFIAMATIFLVATFSVGWTHWWGGLLGMSTIALGILWIITCDKRAALVDDWESMLAELWGQVGLTEIQAHYSDAQRREKTREEMRKGMLNRAKRLLLSNKDIHHARTVLNLVIPFLLILISVWVTYHCFFSGCAS